MGYQDEVEFCGQCNQQVKADSYGKCPTCQKQTVTWDTSRESAQDAKKKWNTVNGR